MLAALRSGDREKVKAALEVLRVELVPPPVPDAENAALVVQAARGQFPQMGTAFWNQFTPALDQEQTDAVMASYGRTRRRT